MSRDISPAQRQALHTLSALALPSAYLAGGVAVALRLHHRTSRDLDLFVPDGDPAGLAPRLGAGVRVLSRAEGTLYLDVAGVPASIIRYGYPLLAPAERLEGIEVPVASLDDLECMKLSAIAGRGARRDFWDLHAMLAARDRTLEEALSAFARKYRTDDVGHVVRSLVYFEDAEAEPMPARLTTAHWSRIRADLCAWVVALA